VNRLSDAVFLEQLKASEKSRHLFVIRRRRIAIWLSRIVIAASFLLFWELGAGVFFNKNFTSSPSEIGRILFQFVVTGSIKEHLFATLIEIAAGYSIGVAAGVFIASLFSFSSRFYGTMFPFIQAFYGIPKVALAPILVMWFGLGIGPKIMISAVMSFFVVFVNTSMGLHSAKIELLNVARVMGASFPQLVRKILIPVALPYTLTAMRVATAGAILGAILGEFVAAQKGIGVVISRGSTQLAAGVVLAGVLILTLLTLGLNGLLIPLEKWLQKRRPPQ
jgi:NitT/TauT family transport system permease protein